MARSIPSTHFSLSCTLTPTAGFAGLGGFLLPAYCCDSTAGNDSNSSSETSVGQGVLVLYDFSTCELSVVVGPGVGVGEELLATSDDGEMFTASASSPASLLSRYIKSVLSGDDGGEQLPAGVKVLGGKLRLSVGQPLELQVFVYYSLLEVFTGDDGQALSTRVHRGEGVTCADVSGVPGGGVGVWLIAAGGGDEGVLQVEGFEMGAMRSIWLGDEDEEDSLLAVAGKRECGEAGV